MSTVSLSTLLRRFALACAMTASALAPALAVSPPDRVHYQGVLRDASGNPNNSNNIGRTGN
jgi:hypothetical protein